MTRKRNSSAQIPLFNQALLSDTTYSNYVDQILQPKHKMTLSREQNTYTVVSLFTGCGGMDLGFLQNGSFRVVFANDVMPEAAATYKRNIGTEFVTAGIESVKAFPKADVVIGGPPCQGFSSANPYRGVTDKRNWLFREYLRVLGEVKPVVFIMENVRGIRTLADGKFYADMKREFRAAGYTLYDAILNAVDYGVPQDRKRNIIVGVDSCISLQYAFPGRSPQNRPLTVGDAIIATPIMPSVENHEFSILSPLNRERLRYIPEGGSMRDCPEHLQNNSDLSRAMRRLNSAQPSYTIVHNNCDHFYHPTEDRRITIREMARLQTFPDSFAISGSKSAQSIQIGNAVPVLFARAIAESIADFLKRRTTA